MYALSWGPNPRARVLNRVHINNWLFRTSTTEKSLVTQNSGVVVRGDESSGNMTWYGVIRNIISLEFPQQKKLYCFSVIGMMCRLPIPAEVEGRLGINLVLSTLLLPCSDI
jgi:hypothetical protein